MIPTHHRQRAYAAAVRGRERHLNVGVRPPSASGRVEPVASHHRTETSIVPPHRRRPSRPGSCDGASRSAAVSRTACAGDEAAAEVPAHPCVGPRWRARRTMSLPTGPLPPSDGWHHRMRRRSRGRGRRSWVGRQRLGCGHYRDSWSPLKHKRFASAVAPRGAGAQAHVIVAPTRIVTRIDTDDPDHRGTFPGTVITLPHRAVALHGTKGGNTA